MPEGYVVHAYRTDYPHDACEMIAETRSRWPWPTVPWTTTMMASIVVSKLIDPAQQSRSESKRRQRCSDSLDMLKKPKQSPIVVTYAMPLCEHRCLWKINW